MSSKTNLYLKNATVGIIGAITLVAGAYGFAARFMAFLHDLGTEDGIAYSLVPVVTYLFAAAGFFCMLIWTFLQGQLSNLETTKYDMLERERELDRRDALYGVGHG